MTVITEALEAVKNTLRVTSSVMDEEITDIIAACKLDLEYAGVFTIVETDPLIKRAIIIYAKAQFGLDNQDSEKYQASYESLKNHLSLCGEYNAVV